MSLPFQSTQDLHDLFVTTGLVAAPAITDDNEGSIFDSLAWIFAIGGSELQRELLLTFNKCFFDMAQGPDENNGGPDDLQNLAVDHFGSAFARPGATQATDTATFSRPSASVVTYGAVTVAKGTVIQTKPDANGKVYQYSTNADVIMTNTNGGAGSDVSVNVGVTALVSGSASNAAAGKLVSISSALLDPTITVTNAGNATGTDSMTSPNYREYIRNLIIGLAGATVAAIEAAALTVAGVTTATVVQQTMTVIQYNPTTHGTVGTYFSIPISNLYVADKTGTASPGLIKSVIAKIAPVQAAGTWIQVAAAAGQSVNWTASYTLNPAGPNYSTLSGSNALIVQAMTNYINNLPVGTNFVRATANAAILAIYGPSGTNDITAFTTSIPTGDVTATATTKFVAGTVTTA